MKVIFDVGANNGDSTLHMAKGNIIYAFEPTPEMCEEIKIKTSGINDYHLIQKAVSNFNGKAKFNIAGHNDWGCSSLYEFTNKLAPEWAWRTDFHFTKQIEVDVIRLDNFCAENHITKIDYFHCDTQGSDLKVLEGLGEYISIVQEGVIEVAANADVALYKGTENTLLQAVEFLTNNGFRDLHITPWSMEYNIHFKR